MGLGIALIALNGAGLLVYAAAHPRETAWLQVWTYLGSDVCKLVSASVILPLLAFVIEAKLDLAETIHPDRARRSSAVQAGRARAPYSAGFRREFADHLGSRSSGRWSRRPRSASGQLRGIAAA